ncbi:MAG: enoyl-CoA hydratase/isomerase family protein [Actinomycetota bacterium]
MTAVIVERLDPVARVILNRPEKRNALDLGLMDEFGEVLRSLARADWARAVILTGAPPAFCAGGDMSPGDERLEVDDIVERHRSFLRSAEMLLELPKPVVAAVNGAAVGAGCSLALACDEVIVARSARLGLGFLKMALPPDLFAASLLQRRAGWTVATDLLHSGRMIGAAEAVELRLAHRQVDDGNVASAALDAAHRLAALSPFAFAATKALLRNAWPPAGGSQEAEAMAVAIAVKTSDFEAAVATFRGSGSGRST